MNKTMIAVVAAVLVLAGGYFLLRGLSPSPEAPPISNQQPVSQPQATQPPATPSTSSSVQNVVTYTDAGYAPGILYVAPGTTVTFTNESSHPMWTASAVHPTHTVYSGTSLDDHCPDTDGTAFDACIGIQPGDSWSFTFTKSGTWGYHNHRAPGHTGTIVVE